MHGHFQFQTRPGANHLGSGGHIRPLSTANEPEIKAAKSAMRSPLAFADCNANTWYHLHLANVSSQPGNAMSASLQMSAPNA